MTMTAGPRAETGTAVIFPGISPCKFADVGRFLVISPVARRLTAVADEALGYSLVDRFRDSQGAYTEPERVAFLVVCVALAYWARDTMGLDPDLCVGPSFGGTPAAVYTGALPFAEAVSMTARWGRCLDEYFATTHADVVTQSFARVPADRLAGIRAELDAEGEWHDLACHVDEDFHMLSLREHKLPWLHHRLRAAGGLPLYTMRPPMHSRAFGPLRTTIERELFGDLHFADPVIPVVCDHDGKVLTTRDEIRTLLLDGVVRAVHWPEAVAALSSRGVRTVYIAGPDALWGRVRCTRDSFRVVPLTPDGALRPRSRPSGRPRAAVLAAGRAR